MLVGVHDPEGRLPWRTVRDLADRRRQLLAVRSGIYERIPEPGDEEAEQVGDVLVRLLNELGLAQLIEAGAMGPPAGASPPEGARPAASEASEDTQPGGRGPIEAGGSEPAGSRATGGRYPVVADP